MVRVLEVIQTPSQDSRELGRNVLNFEEIVQQFRPRIFRFALSSLGDRDVAETIAQDCMLRAWLSRDSFRGTCSPQSWLMKIAVNLIRDHARSRRYQFWWRLLRRNAPEALIACASNLRSPETALRQKQQLNAIWTAAQTLPERQRTVFLLRFVEDMDILEIAEAAGIKEGTVKAHLFRALTAVRAKLGITL